MRRAAWALGRVSAALPSLPNTVCVVAAPPSAPVAGARQNPGHMPITGTSPAHGRPAGGARLCARFVTGSAPATGVKGDLMRPRKYGPDNLIPMFCLAAKLCKDMRAAGFTDNGGQFTAPKEC
jgi:hypothetical protein